MCGELKNLANTANSVELAYVYIQAPVATDHTLALLSQAHRENLLYIAMARTTL